MEQHSQLLAGLNLMGMCKHAIPYLGLPLTLQAFPEKLGPSCKNGSVQGNELAFNHKCKITVRGLYLGAAARCLHQSKGAQPKLSRVLVQQLSQHWTCITMRMTRLTRHQTHTNLYCVKLAVY